MTSMRGQAIVFLLGLSCMATVLGTPAPPPAPPPVTPPGDSPDRWPPHHVIDEDVAALELARCRKTWNSAEEWQQRADRIRAHLRTVMDLDLDAPRPPVTATVHHRRELDGYAVSNVLLETAPGLFVAANLYEPLDREGKRPIVLCPHGHFRGTEGNPEGRFQHNYQKLCGSLARMGAIVVTWDMVGWGESTWLPHRVPATTTLQTWNSIRMIDWLTARDDVDASRIGMTGSSGGGTQTFLATALDDRITAAVPVVMVSAHWFGGCDCESGLPVHQGKNLQTNNVEFAACAAPRPLLLVSCGGDWTSNTPRIEYPYLQAVYEALGQPEACENVHLADEIHDYGPGKRKATYGFLARHLGLDESAIQGAEGSLDESRIVLQPRLKLIAVDESNRLPDQHVLNHEGALGSIQSITKPR